MPYVFKNPVGAGDTSLSTLNRDSYINGSATGINFLFDTTFPFSYPGGNYVGRSAAGAPANGALITDIAERGNGSFVKDAATMTYAGGGFDFSALSSSNSCFSSGTSSTLSNIFASQYYMIFMYIKLPTLANWNTSGSVSPFFTSTLSYYVVDVDIGIFCFTNSPALQFRRQTAVGAQTPITIDGSSTPSALSVHYGLMAQVAFWRNASGTGIRVKSSGGTSLVTAASGSSNSANFSATTPRFGPATNPFGSNMGRQYRIYRGGIENLAISGRDPVTVLDADWARVQTRITASGSTIFV